MAGAIILRRGGFEMGGGGGFVGTVINYALMVGALNRGYATVDTDTGHRGNAVDASWALNDMAALVNFGHLAVHRTAINAKSFIKAYYGKRSDRNLFVGCSRGGGQALNDRSGTRRISRRSTPVRQPSTGLMYNNAEWTYKDYDVADFGARAALAAAALNADSPDLAAFRARGGKLIIDQGWMAVCRRTMRSPIISVSWNSIRHPDSLSTRLLL